MAAIFDNPADSTFDAYGKAVAAGQLYNDTLRKNMAFNALAKAYGPSAGDPVLAKQLQENEQAKAMDPLLQQQQSLQNAGLQQTQDFNAKHDPQVLQAGNIANATNQNALDQTQKVQKAQQVHVALSGALSSLGTSLNGVTDPNQRLSLFDAQIDQLAPQLGVDPTQLKQELAQQRAAIAAQGADALPQIQQQIDAVVDANLSPQERVQLANAKAQAALLSGRTGLVDAQTDLAKSKADAEAAKHSGIPTAAQAEALKTTVIPTYSQTLQRLSDVETLLTQVSPNPLIRKANSYIPGKPEYQLEQAAKSIGASNAINDLRAQRDLGLSLGRTNLAEFMASANALANFDIGQNIDTLKQNVDAMQAMYKDKIDDANARLAKGAVAAPAADGTNTAAPASYDGDPNLWQYLSPEEQKLWQ